MNNKYIKTVKYVESPELRDLIKENIIDERCPTN